MGSSPGFGSNPRHPQTEVRCALFRLAFAAAPQRQLLNLATQIKSSAHSSIGTPLSRRIGTLTACRHTVSGSISLPSRGSFHLSLTVLVHYRSSRVFSLGGWAPLLPTGLHVSRGTQGHRPEPSSLSPTGLSPSMAAHSRDLRLERRFVTPCPSWTGLPSLTTP